MWPLLRNFCIAVFVLTGVAVAVRDLSGNVGRDGTEKPPSVATADGTDGELEIAKGPRGHFVLEAEVNGEPVEFVVDTGASIVVVGPETAERLGFDLDSLEYTGVARTANGTTPIAPIILDTIVIGDLTVSAVEAAVVGKPMATSLLRVSFLAWLEGYEVRGGRLVLRG